ncbi:MAG: aldehyde dehydrogenase EutE [Acidobacteria bacterium]|nr:aldehyde dehydrogenase EutE [Acidobacteriota bacterium]
MLATTDSMVAAIVEEVLQRLQPQLASPASVRQAAGGDFGVFPTVDKAVKAARAAQKVLATRSLEERGEVIEIIRRLSFERAEELGRMEFEESQLGRLDHKIEKLRLVKKVLGVEALKTEARSDTSGVCLIEYAPFGVIAMVSPSTHGVPTMGGNAINVIAGGNTAVFSSHPATARSVAYAVRLFNQEIEKKTGLRDLLTTVESPSIESANELFRHRDIALICVTGGAAVVAAAMQSGKRVVAAGPGNPPVLVDETADLNKAAEAIIAGASFDNNLLCISEKEVFVVSKVADEFVAAMKRAGASQLNHAQIEKLTQTVFTFEDGTDGGRGRAHVKHEFVGKDPAVLASAIGVRLAPETPLLFGETDENHAFVQTEQLMPFLPVVRVACVDEGIRAALKAEHGYRHTAIIHSRNAENVTKMARALNTTMFIQNAPCFASLGSGGPGYLSWSIATPTGEGVTTPLTFTRQRQLTMAGALRII